MPPEQEVIKNEVDIDAALAKIDSNLKEKVDSMENRLLEKVEALKPKPEPDPEPTYDPDEDEEPVTRADLRAVVKETLAAAKEVAKDTSAEVFKETDDQRTIRQSRDEETMRDFPMLFQGTAYDEEFHSLVSSEITARVKRGRDRSDPDLIYDAAASVKSKSNKWNQTSQQKLDDEERGYRNREAGFNVRGRNKINTSKPNERQLGFARSVNLDPKYLEDHMKKNKL